MSPRRQRGPCGCVGDTCFLWFPARPKGVLETLSPMPAWPYRFWLLSPLALSAALSCAHAQSSSSGEAGPPPGAASSTAQAPEDEHRAAEALYAKAEAARQKGDLAAARVAYGELAARYPLEGRADDAKRRLAEIDLAQGHFSDAEQSLKSLYPHTAPADRPRAARALAEAAEGAGDAVEAVRDDCALLKLDGVTPADAAQIQEALARVVEVQLSANDGARLAGELGDCPAQEGIAFKRALTLYHLGDAQAQGALSDVLARYPGSKYAPSAKGLLDRLRARSAQPVKPGLVGVLVPQSPDAYAAYGRAALEGLKAALGDDAALIVRDTKGEAAEAVKGVEELAGQGVQVILGPILPGETEAAAVKAQELGIPMITLTRTEGITRVGNFIFRNMLTDSAQAEAIAHYAIDVRGYKKLAVLYPEVEYGKEMMSLFWRAAEAKGASFRAAESYPFDTTTFKSYAEHLVGRADLELRADWIQSVRELKAQGLTPLQQKKALRKLREGLKPVVDFDAIFIADSARNVALVAPQLAVENVVTDGCNDYEQKRIFKTTGEHPKTVELLGWTAWFDPDFDLVQRAGRYVQCSVFVDGFFAESARPETQAFVAAFQKGYGHAPGLMEAEAHDAGRLIQEAQKRAPATREAFRDALAAVKGVRGATGDCSVGPTREVQKPLFYVTITDKGYQELDLTKVAPADPSNN